MHCALLALFAQPTKTMEDQILKYQYLSSRKALLSKLCLEQPFRVSVGKSKWVDYNEFKKDYNMREILQNEIVIEFDTLHNQRAWFASHETCINLFNAGYNFEVWCHGGKSPHIHVRNLPTHNVSGDNLRMFKKLFIRKYVPLEYMDIVDYSLTGIHMIAMEWQFHWKGCYGYKILLTSFGGAEDIHKLNVNQEENMGTIAQEAQNYEPKTTKNICELDIVSTSLDVEDRTGTDNDGKEFGYKVIVQDGEDYRMPLTVLAALKDILAKKSDLKSFSVTRSGTGRDTRYTVIPQV